MKKYLVIVLIVAFVLSLSACAEPSIERLIFELNPGVDTIELGSEHEDAGAKATYGFRTIDVEIVSNDVDTSQVGEYEIVYYATHLGFEKTLTRKVTVVNELLPKVTLNPGLDTVYIGDAWVDEGVSSDEDISVTILGTVDTQTVGEYMITYVITDIDDQELRLYRYVNVIER